MTQFSIEGRHGETNLAKAELARLARVSSSKTDWGAFIAGLAQVPIQSGSKWGLSMASFSALSMVSPGPHEAASLSAE